MEFSLPIKYLYNYNRIVDPGLMDAICEDFNTSWDFFPDFIGEESEFLSLLSRSCPEGNQAIKDGILTVDIYDYYDEYFHFLPKYCRKNLIPLDYIEEPEFTSEQTIFTFIRPNIGTRYVAVDENHNILVGLDEIMTMINNTDENKTDTEIMIDISNFLEKNNPRSEMNSIKNWV